MAEPSLSDILDAAGLDADGDIRHYLDHMRIQSVGALAHMFADGEAISTWVTRFTTAVTFGNPPRALHLRSNDLVLGTTASLTAAWATQTTAPTDTNTPSSQITPATPATEVKFPKKTTTSVYASHCQDVARTPPKRYTAPALGEILTQRTFTAMGAINNSAKDRRSERTLTLDSSNLLVEPDDDIGRPRGRSMGLDLHTDQRRDRFIDIFCRSPGNTNSDLDLHLAAGDENAIHRRPH